MDDDKIIIDGLTTIRTGIIERDWQIICDGFNLITGESLEPQLSRVERIREAFKNNNQSEDIDLEGSTERKSIKPPPKEVDLYALTIDKIKSKIKDDFSYVKPSDLSKRNKDKLIELWYSLKDYEESEEEPDDGLIHIEASNSGQTDVNVKPKEFTVISTPINKVEAAENRSKSIRDIANPQKRHTELSNLSSMGDKDIQVILENPSTKRER